MTTLVNRAKVSTATTGTGTLTLGLPAASFQSFADAGVTNGATVRYVIEDGANWEIGVGTYSSTGPTLTRGPTESSNAGVAINLSGNAYVFLTAGKEELQFAADMNQGVATTDSPTFAGLTAATADVNGGTVDGTVIGGTTPAAISGTTGSFTGDLTIADKIVHSGDTNTAVRFPAADTVTVETGGAERMRIDAAGNVGIGTTAPAASAILDVSSTTKGFLGPRLTTAQRTAIVSPATGLLVYNTDISNYEQYNGSAWVVVGGGGGYFQGENGAVGQTSGKGDIFRVHEQTLNTNTTIAGTDNAIAAGPLTVASGVTLTVNGNLAIV